MITSIYLNKSLSHIQFVFKQFRVAVSRVGFPDLPQKKGRNLPSSPEQIMGFKDDFGNSK